MKKDQFDRQPDPKPAEPYAGGHGSKGAEPGFQAPNPSEKDKDKLRRKPEQPMGKPADTDRFDSERSDRTSGRPVQLENEDMRPQPGQGDRQQEARRPTGEPIKH